jgi:hypothetical protein
MRVLLWAWIIGFTAFVLYMPPMLEKLPTRQGEAARWSNKGAFEQSVLQSSIGETRVDISRLIISLLAINFLPAVALWRCNAIRDWLQRHESQLVRLGIILVSLMIVVVLISVVLQLASSGGANAAGPPAASAKHRTQLIPTKGPGDWVDLVDPTPTPIRRAIPISPESRR